MITVIGLDGSPLEARAAAAIRAATLVVGGRRHLQSVEVPRGARTVALGDLGSALETLAGHSGDAVVLASGDPGFFGILRALRRSGLACTVLPAVSSVALAFARAGLPWDDAVVVSAHGRDLRRAVNVCRASRKVAVLTGPGAGPAEIGAALAGWQRRLVVCEHLGGDAERVIECRPAAARRQTWADPNVVLVLDPRVAAQRAAAQEAADGQARAPLERSPRAVTQRAGRALDGGARWTWPRVRAALPPGGDACFVPQPPEPLPWGGDPSFAPQPPEPLPWGAGPRFAPEPPAVAGWALPEEAFDTRDAVITKAEVRALALARLGPAPGQLVWDVGAGTGSVAVECARFGAAVVAVERDTRRCARVRVNARRHGVDVRVINGEAPASLAWLPDPDSVFIGGGGTSVVEAVALRGPARIVVALAALERAGQAMAALASAGYAVDGVLLQAARFAPLPGDVHRLASTNPVFLLWAAPATTAGRGGPP
jgi:precorrin-6Y C5,15-methyltransferase (decarboxylating)